MCVYAQSFPLNGHSYAPVHPTVQPYLRWRLCNIAMFSLLFHFLIFRRNIETHKQHIAFLVAHKRKIGKWVSFLAFVTQH